MHQKLQWNAIGLERKSKILKEAIQKERDKLLSEDLRDFRKLQRFLDEFDLLTKRMTEIRETLIPFLEGTFRLKFQTPELIMLALARPSIRNLFAQTHDHLTASSVKILSDDEFVELTSAGDAANALALIGDSVIGLSIVQMFWDSSLVTAGALAEKRQTFGSNRNLSKVCDAWKLYEYRLKGPDTTLPRGLTGRTLEHEKGTLVEALSGVIYVEL